MSVIHYTIFSDIPERENEFKTIAQNVLNDPRGWKKYGYSFVLDSDTKRKPNTIKITLSNVANLRKGCMSLSGLSCYNPNNNNVYINIENWIGNDKNAFGTARINEYREYVINHEVGHALGLDHMPPAQKKARAGKFASVMLQHSKGADWILPCLPNSWPLDSSDYDEFKMTPKITTRITEQIDGGATDDITDDAAPMSNKTILRYILIFICIIFFVYTIAPKIMAECGKNYLLKLCRKTFSH